MELDERGGSPDVPLMAIPGNPGSEADAGQRPLYPEIVRHPYAPHALNEAIILYRGSYCLPPSDPDEQAYDGTIELKWLPEPEIEVCGERAMDLLERLRAGNAREEERPAEAWTMIPTVRLTGSADIPPMPALSAAVLELPPRAGSVERLTTMIYPPEFGNGAGLTRVTGLVVNGFDAGDGQLVMDPVGGWWPVGARSVGRGGGWVVTVDSLVRSHTDWKELEQSRGYQATQVVEISRDDGAVFSAEQANQALEVIGYGLTLALGRHVCVTLPIGWRHEEPVWARWRFRRTDPFRDTGTWLDHMITSAQVGELLGKVLDIWDDEQRRETLRDACSYLVQAQSGQAELGITLPISGLTLLSYSHLVERVGAYSKGQWKDLNVGGQIRALIISLRSVADLAVPVDLGYLEALRARMATMSPKPVFDALSCIIEMRNAIMHPKPGERSDWTYEQIVEGHLLATHLFEMTLLAYVGYRGQVHPRIAAERMAGYVEDVPWAAA
jgi:hypothetical protein